MNDMTNIDDAEIAAEAAAMQQEIVREPGETLSNGAIVIAVKHPLKGGRLKVVLAIADGCYATWKFDPKDGACFWGDYFTDINEAVASFNSRVAGIGD